MNCVSIFTADHAKHSNLALLGTACFVCSRIPDELVQCPICNRISYCSAECRTADFESHMKICVALRVTTTATSASDRRSLFREGDIADELEPYVAMLVREEISLFEKMLDRLKVESTCINDDLFMYTPRCTICLRSAVDMRSIVDPEYTSLLHCPDCRASFACSERHRTAYHDEHCRKLEDEEDHTECEMNKRSYEHSLEIVARGWTLTETIWFPMRRKSEYTPLPSSWDEWFADPSNLCPPDSSPVLNRVRTWQLSIPMTILYGMEMFDKSAGESPLLLSRSELEIAVVGADNFELKFGGLACFEEILHNLPSLRRLTVCFIGPEVSQEALEWAPCALCKENGVELVHSIHSAAFHDYVEERTTQLAVEHGPVFRWPDIAVMFNSGMGLHHRKKSGWSPTLEMLSKNGVPTLCTSFLVRESEEDENCLTLHRCNTIIERHKNPWRSEVVTKAVYSMKGFFSYNGYIQGFRGRREGEIEYGSEPSMDQCYIA